MRCHICDKTLTEGEIQVSPSGHGYEPCSVCMEIALDAAYCDGFVRPDDLDEVDTLEGDTFLTEAPEFLFHSPTGYSED